jgi:hypothetical protein
MAIERREMKDVGIWIQLGRDFINFCKPFFYEGGGKKILLNNFLETIHFV